MKKFDDIEAIIKIGCSKCEKNVLHSLKAKQIDEEKFYTKAVCSNCGYVHIHFLTPRMLFGLLERFEVKRG